MYIPLNEMDRGRLTYSLLSLYGRSCRKLSTLRYKRLLYQGTTAPTKTEILTATPSRRLFLSSVIRGTRSKDGKDLSSLFVPLTVKPNQEDGNVGEELTEKLDKRDLMRLLTQFYQRKQVKQVCIEQGLDKVLYHQAFMSFRRYCLESESLPVDLHVVLSDVIQGAGHVDDIVPYFIRHARQIFPHLECMDDLKKIGDLTSPPNWYPEARKRERKIIFHAGPTNSGKTYHALERLLSADSGVYCGPLKLLATEVYEKANAKGTPCDLVTGEERRMANDDGSPSKHVSCTVEMTSVSTDYDVAIIDEIQMLRDQQRGWAWTRALLGVSAKEIHVCGEPTAVDMVRDICISSGEELEVRKYKRLTGLTAESEAINNFNNIRAGDCIVCFSKNDIYYVSRELEKRGTECGVIYGALPPGTKLAQARKFNDPNNPCKVLVATDAIGMGLNLSIRRIVFYSLMKANINEKGEKEMDTIPTHLALQIAGRAGRYGTPYPEGHVTTFKPEDLPVLKTILSRDPEPINRAGLHPTADQIELYAYNLPNATLSNLVDIFVNLCTVDDSLYFMCQLEDFKFMADMIQHVPLPLRARYVFCCAPINRKMPFVCTMFLKFARQFSNNEPITYDWLCVKIGWPFSPPQTIMDLVHLEAVFDVLDLYLWFSYRFVDIFPDAALVRDTQKELDAVIQEGVFNITRLLRQSEAGRPPAVEDEESFQMQTRHQTYLRGPRFLEEDNSQTVKFRGSPVLRGKTGRNKNLMEGDNVSYGGGKLTERLISQGLLTPRMIEELRRELADDKIDDDPSNDNPSRGHKS